MQRTGTLRKGFTIVELSIVIIVIAILATVAVLSYGAVRQNALESTMKADLSNAMTKIEKTKTDTGLFPADGTALERSGDNVISYVSTSGNYCVSVTNPRTSKIFRIQSPDPAVREGQC